MKNTNQISVTERMEIASTVDNQEFIVAELKRLLGEGFKIVYMGFPKLSHTQTSTKLTLIMERKKTRNPDGSYV